MANEASKRLADWFAAKEWTQEVAAKELRCHQTTLSKILAGKRGVGLELAVRIETLSADWSAGPIRPAEWTTPAESLEATGTGS